MVLSMKRIHRVSEGARLALPLIADSDVYCQTEQGLEFWLALRPTISGRLGTNYQSTTIEPVGFIDVTFMSHLHRCILSRAFAP